MLEGPIMSGNAGPITSSMNSSRPILHVEDLKVHFEMQRSLKEILRGTPPNLVKAVDGVSFSVAKREVLGLVGETGCGKSTIAKTVLRMNPISAGSISFGGQDVRQIAGKSLKDYYAQVQMVWQDPFTSLNPRMKVRDIIRRPLVKLTGCGAREGLERVKEIMRVVGLNQNELDRYPHEFSGGGRQRIVIARALVSRPSFVITDEPTSSLDVSIQAQILNLLKTLKEDFNLSMLFISHDIAVINFICNRIGVMYLGRIVELMGREDLFRRNYHWYTHELIESVPKGRRLLSARVSLERNAPVDSAGCIYCHRCQNAQPRCRDEEPLLRPVDTDHFVACHFPRTAEPNTRPLSRE